MDAPRIKRNIGKMIDQGASEQEIDAYISGEGVTAEQLRAAPAQRFKFPSEAEQAEAFVRARREESPIYDAAVKARTFLSGVPVVGGLVDEGLAAVGADSPRDYEQRLEHARAMERVLAEDNPKTAMGLEAAGTVAGVAPAIAAAPGVPAAAIAGRSLPSLMAGGAALGGAEGAIEGFTRGEGGAANRLSNAVTGAGWGAGLGATFVPGARAIGAGVRGVNNWWARRAAAEGADMTPTAASKISGAMADDAVNTAAAARTEGDFGMLADMGPRLQQQAGSLAAEAKAGRTVMRDALQDRAASATDRVRDAVNQGLGPNPNVPDLAADITRKKLAQASPYYDAALRRDPSVEVGPVVAELERLTGNMRNLRPETTLRQDSRTRRLLDILQFFQTQGDQGPQNVPAIDLGILHNIKMDLDDEIAKAVRQERGLLARDLITVQESLLRQMDAASPEYQVARGIYSGGAQIEDALQEGQRVFERATSPDELAARMAGMSESERDAFTAGARAQIARVMGTARNDASAAVRELGKGWNREKLAIIIGDDAAGQIDRALRREATFADTAQTVTRNSETAARLLGQQDIATPSPVVGPLRQSVEQRGILGSGLRGIERLIESMRLNRSDRSSADMARALTATGESRDRIVDALLRYRHAQGVNSAAGQQVEAIIDAMAIPGAAVQAGGDSRQQQPVMLSAP